MLFKDYSHNFQTSNCHVGLPTINSLVDLPHPVLCRWIKPFVLVSDSPLHRGGDWDSWQDRWEHPAADGAGGMYQSPQRLHGCCRGSMLTRTVSTRREYNVMVQNGSIWGRETVFGHWQKNYSVSHLYFYLIQIHKECLCRACRDRKANYFCQ